jgi:tRNA-dihydrouridine synthase
MIAQSAIGNPWILTPHTPSIHEKYKIITDHLQLMCAAESYFIQAVDKYDQEQKLLMPTLAQLKQIARKLSDQSQQTASLRSPIEFRKYLFNYVS